MPEPMSYVYAVAREVPSSTLRDLRGVGDRDVHPVSVGDLQALVSDVPPDEFDTDALESRLQDLTWLADTARAHHRVVDAVGAATVVAPLALATVFYDRGRVRAVLEQRRAEFTTVLDDLDGRSEWGIKAYVPTTPPQDPDRSRPTSGADYLRRRKAAVGAADRVVESARASAAALHDIASDAAVRSHLHRVHDAALTGRTDQMVLNGAYLVDRDRADAWHAAVGPWVTAGTGAAPVVVEVTGPWVPYSFVDGASG